MSNPYTYMYTAIIFIHIHTYIHAYTQFILDLRPFKEAGIVEEDVAKRLQVHTYIIHTYIHTYIHTVYLYAYMLICVSYYAYMLLGLWFPLTHYVLARSW